MLTPLAAGLYASDKLSGEKKVAMDTRHLLKKAADVIEVHRRREEAVKLAMLMVERGKCEPFDSYGRLSEKVAELESKNLDVVREALDMESELVDLGKVASSDVTLKGSSRAEASFWHRLSE